MVSKKNAKRIGRSLITRNICKNYEYQEGTPYPESIYSCRGCKNSRDPERYDPGCKIPNGYDPRSRS